jgi:hypothetical protein|tara:strand:+ start:952 stop:1530 length:579 start_codon:yes stop_codon:yes gene_type:complete
MACTALTKGRGLDCNRISGGIKYVYFAVYDQVFSVTRASGEISDIEMTVGADTGKLYRYTMPLGVASLTDTINGSRENGTIFYTPTISLILNKLTKEDQNQIKLLGQSRVMVFAQLNQQLTNGHDVIVGLGTTNGMELNAGTMDSGAAWGDRNGYTLTFDGIEPEPFPMVLDFSSSPFDNIDDGGAIDIVGS